jgi:hypothetical protein
LRGRIDRRKWRQTQLARYLVEKETRIQRFRAAILKRSLNEGLLAVGHSRFRSGDAAAAARLQNF